MMFRALGLYLYIVMVTIVVIFELWRLIDHVGDIFSRLAGRGL